MSKETSSSFYRPFAVTQLKPGGVEIKVEANDVERATIAADFGMPEIRSLTGEFKLTGRPDRIKLLGSVQADIQQICVVSLEPFDSYVVEDVDMVFADEDRRGKPAEQDVADDIPDPIVDGQIDLGAVTLEFLALGLDPYPRKPGISFDEVKKALGLSEDTSSSLGEFGADKGKRSS